MVDLILMSFTVAMFAGGFWAGNKFRTYAAMWQAAKDWIK